MSELKVNSITPLSTTGIRFNSPVGINTVAPNSGLQINGKLNVVDNNLEVVTVGTQNYGIKIKASPSTNESILQFANYDGSERAHIKSTASGDLIFNTSGVTAAQMSLGGGFNVLSTAQFNKPVTFNGTTQFNNQATFLSNFIPKCAGVPTVDEHLVNLAYLKKFTFSPNTVKTWQVFGNVNNGGFNGCCSYYNGCASTGDYSTTLAGKWLIIGFSFGQRGCSCYDNEQFHFPIDRSAVWNITSNSVQSTITTYLGTPYNAFGIAVKIDVATV
jgi:hypothetical protein